MKLFLSFLCISWVLAAAPITRVTLVNAGHPLVSDGSYYVGPYTLALDSRDVSVLCIDFADRSKVGAQWNAYVSPVAGSLAHTYHPGGLFAYEEEAYLYTLIAKTGADRVDIQHAAWAILDPTYQPNKAAEKWVSQAANNYRSIDPNDFVIVSEAPGQAGVREQELITLALTPEPALMNLLAGLLAISLAVIGRRRN